MINMQTDMQRAKNKPIIYIIKTNFTNIEIYT